MISNPDTAKSRPVLARLLSSPAFAFVLVMGLVNLFADWTYEGGAAINGPFLASLGAKGAAVSIIAGLGEFLGYSLRPLSGFLADKTGRFWPLTFLGYFINLLAVPAMALAHSWQLAAAFILAERIGRAIRKPTVEAMLSYSTGKHGKGWVYAVNTALDETGATLGPLSLTLLLFLGASYRHAYALLLISSLLALAALTAARLIFPVSANLETGGPPTAPSSTYATAYWLYMTAGACFAAGLMSFELISYHLAVTGTVPPHLIPLFLAISTAAGIVASLALGRLYDRAGIWSVITGVVLTALFPPLVFLGRFRLALAGLLLWGVGYATQDTLLKAVIASLLPQGKRGSAFGLFYLGYAVGWLIGSIATGLLYSHSRHALVAFATITLLISLPFFALASRAHSRP